MGTIVVGYVANREGRVALDRAAEEAQLRSSRLVVVNSDRGGHKLGRVEAGETEQGLAEVGHELDMAGVDHEIRGLEHGTDPVANLVNVAAEVAADLIVIGLRRRTAVGKLILGTNAQRVLLDAPCPVLTVKAEESSQ